jgi:hypothetical protein
MSIKCQAATIQEETKFENNHWQAMMSLHRALAHEQFDFFLASLHPSGSPAMKRLADKHSMPARYLEHRIYSFLELMRYRLPESHEFMICFIYDAYRMMTLLYETAPAFKTTWVEYLGNIGRYRMAIEEEEDDVREHWADVARSWYTEAKNDLPDVGRYYHHLAILAKYDELKQLSLYSRSLTSAKIFKSARESILTLFTPVLEGSESYSAVPEANMQFIKVIALLFHYMERQDNLDGHIHGLLEPLSRHISHIATAWQEQGAFIAITLLGGRIRS